MRRARIIPCLLISGNDLVKTRQFKERVYIGDPVNAVRIFSEKEVDEVVILDIDASRDGNEPNYRLVEEMAGEAFMPMAYGGGVRNIMQVRRLIRAGVEKVVINTAAVESEAVVREAALEFGSQAVVVGIDVRRSMFGRARVMIRSGTVEVTRSAEEHARQLVAIGAGEILLSSIDRDGMMKGYDLPLLQSVTKAVTVPVVACGGAGTAEHLREAVRDGGASAVAAGSMFVFHGKHRAVLINYPTGLAI